MLSLQLFGALMAVYSTNTALAAPSATMGMRAVCDGNTPSTRSEWCDHSIDIDWWTEAVDIGVTREYWLELTDVNVAPDGVSRTAMAVIGLIPGPTIFADWGDTVIVHVTNSLSASLNGTSIHFHGMRQNNTNQHDGVAAVTQCPVAVGESVIYTWKATQYGSSWYHSNFALQEYQGIFGGIIINGPASANYDEDLGVVFLNDWDHQTVDELYAVAQTNGPPMLDNGLINGTNVYGDDDDASQTGNRLTITFTAGTSYRMRLVNAAVDTHWKFSIDNHTLTVIAADLVPVEPYVTTMVDLTMGQRYDIIVTANQAEAADSFWMRAIPQSACSDNESTDNIKAIVYYGDSVTTPKTIGYDYTDSCDDETDNLVPVVSKAVESADWSDLAIATVGRNSAGLFKWYLNSTSLLVDWADPTLGQVLTGATEWETKNAVLQLSEANKWVYLVVQTAMGVPHPIHLHGHDFFVLAQGSGIYSASVTLNTENPPRRDTALLPASGYLVMAWETDNPGVWLMHCHIGWHASEGFALQFIERYSEIGGISDESSLNDGCSTWSSFQDTYSIEQEDSGI
ncbi:Laccase-2 like protein [Verticillium longisporum]|nr:Laccase-2 like protein [Verticillium longisporum]KAG7139473.1 Laccase-2 like protein [Verticillium longisporum]